MQENSQTRLVASQRKDWPLSFRHPKAWELRPTPMKEGVKYFARGPLGPAKTLFPFVAVRARPIEGQSLAQLVREWIQQRSAFRTFRLLARTETSLAGMEAIQLDAAHEMPATMDTIRPEMVTVQERVIFALRDGKAYQLTYRAIQGDFQEHLPVFQDLAASLSLEE